jgi:hypothetical protein
LLGSRGLRRASRGGCPPAIDFNIPLAQKVGEAPTRSLLVCPPHPQKPLGNLAGAQIRLLLSQAERARSNHFAQADASLISRKSI